MRRPMKLITMASVAVAALGVVVGAQNRRPASPVGSSATEVGGKFSEREGYVGGKWIEVQYGRPIRRGRNLFGPADYAEALKDGAPVWRAGANVSTRLMTEVPLAIGGKTVAPGTYTLFIDLKGAAWTFIVSTWPAQTTYDDKNKQALWGAYEYTPDRDVVRTPMKVETLPFVHEQLSWEFLDMSDAGGRLALFWDKKMASVAFRIGG
ncbi:MAG: hypothetical protein DMF89_17925 [Acidobacteria bacterium]|nr:MAG: hypothetical protein DMF90_27225 [Acidobacteriota bacterium]PYR47786.1 MAG: hypothetical protein DMF89_17925 [Acidobacteriota bacterium]